MAIDGFWPQSFQSLLYTHYGMIVGINESTKLLLAADLEVLLNIPVQYAVIFIHLKKILNDFSARAY